MRRSRRWRVKLAAVAFLAFPFFEEGCSTAPSPAPAPTSAGGASIGSDVSSSPSQHQGARIVAARAAYAAARRVAWAPRRFKALFKAEVSPKVGAVGRGFLSVFWNGETLAWRSSAPLAGAGRGGTLTRGDDAPSDLFPGNIAAADLVATILGVPDAEISDSSPLEERSGLVVLRLGNGGRSAGLDRAGRVVFFSFPGGVEVKYQPGEGVPRRIEATGPDGRALLVLESFGPWPENEPVPPA